MWQRVTPAEAIDGRGMVPRHYLAIGVRPLAKMAACADEIRHFVVEQDIGPPDDGCSIRLRCDLVMGREPAGSRAVVVVDEGKKF
jgi:hypothetical protein